MPELPEVQTVVDDLIEAGLSGARITDAQVFWPRTIATPAPDEFCSAIVETTIESVWRRAKFIIIGLSDGKRLLIHLRMTGRLLFSERGAQRSKHEHVILTLGKERELRFQDTRKFGRMYLVDDEQAVIGDLGPEPLDKAFTLDVFKKLIGDRKRALKPLLLDQTVIAGLGNIYVDEALWEAELHPLRLASSLNDSELTALHTSIPNVLKRGLRNMGTTLGDGETNFYSISGRRGRNKHAINVFRRTGDPCPRCATIVERIIVGQRSTHICPTCQREP